MNKTNQEGPDVITLGPNELVEWVTYEDTEYYTRTYNPVNSSPIANLLLIHGFGEHSDRYEAMARKFAAENIRVFAFDLKGFGKTGRKQGQLGNIGPFENTYKTIHHFSKELQAKFSSDQVPLFLYGHSMGGCIVLNYAAIPEHSSELAGVIASSPALLTNPEVMPPAFVVSALKMVSRVFPSIPISSKIDPDDLTSNQVELEKFKQSFYNYNLSNIGSVSSMLEQGDLCRTQKSKSFSVPCLVAHGKGDKVTSSNGSTEFYNNLPSSLDKKLVVPDSNYHELHFEQDFRDMIIGEYLLFIKSHLHSPSQPSSQ
ncbi:putative monoglyceride lipase [Smittium mucronatum]|uniref:Putative monoglyceride lipase n=1 Tax=Smittium mucronatum TaxID=133383 RepID=A0A1R0GZJ2_9FUNG|nr:putative monoglyceride lipase [Smittium mucronatum]